MQIIAILCICLFGKVQNIAFSYFMQLSNCYILHLSIWKSTEYSFYNHFLPFDQLGKYRKLQYLALVHLGKCKHSFYSDFCSCPIMKVQTIAILCTCLLGQVQNTAFSHFLQLSKWGSAENSYIMHQAIWESIHISVTRFWYCRFTWYYMKLIHKEKQLPYLSLPELCDVDRDLEQLLLLNK